MQSRKLNTLFVLVTCLILPVFSTCPNEVNSICRCTRIFSGYSLDCSYMNFTEVVESLTARRLNAPIAKLKLTLSPIPVLHARAFQGLVIHELDLSDTKMQRVDADALIGQIPDLNQLILANNSLTSIPTLRNFNQLKVIDLSGNQLSDVPAGIFTDLPNLQHLKLGRNEICSLARDALSEVKGQLTLLDLNGNCLSSVPAQNIRGFTELSWLDLSGNRIPQLGDLQFVNMPELKDVFLEDNEISAINQLAFMNVPKLATLSLRNNRLASLSANRFQSFLNLKMLDLRDNRLDRLGPSSFRDLEKLQQLLLDGNQIERLDTFAFSNNKQLKIVSLQNNRISEIGPNAFDGHATLTYLLLTNNSLAGITQDMLSGMPNLQQLSLRNNSLSRLGPGAFQRVPEVTSLDLGHNRMRSVPSGVFTDLPKLFWLDLSHNRIARVDKDAFIFRVPNILIHDNPLVCDENMDWFVSYLVKHNVRIFLPTQSDITCKGPENLAGTRLKDLLLKKANQTLFRNLNGFIDPESLQKSIADTAINGYLRGASPEMLKNFALSSNSMPLDKLVPGINQALPGISGLPSMLTTVPLPSEIGPSLSKFTGPIAKLAVGEPPENLASDVGTMLRNLPNLVSSLPAAVPRTVPGAAQPLAPGAVRTQVNTAKQPIGVPGFPGLTLDNLSPSVIQYALKGGKIPGVPDAVVQSLLQQHLRQSATPGHTPGQTGQQQVTYPYGSNGLTPASLVTQSQPVFPSGNSLVTQGYTNGITVPHANGGMAAGGPRIITGSPPSSAEANPVQPTLDLTGLSPEIIKSLSQGKLPDLRKYPEFIQTLQENPGLLSVLENTQGAKGADGTRHSIEDPSSNRNRQATSDQSYDIDELMQTANLEKGDQSNALLITGISLGTIGALTLVILATLCYRRRSGSINDENLRADSLFYGTGIPSMTGSPPKSDFDHIDFTHRDRNPPEPLHAGPNMTSSSQALVYDTINWPGHVNTTDGFMR